MKITALCLLSLLLSFIVNGQGETPADSAKQKYLDDLRTTGRQLTNYLNANRMKIFALSEKPFIAKTDSLRKLFTFLLGKYAKTGKPADPLFIQGQQKEIHYYFDKFLLDYPYFHEIATGKKVMLSLALQQRLNKNKKDFNNPALLSNSDFQEYIRGFLHHESNEELKKAFYKKSDNQRITSVLAVIPRYFTTPACRDFWQYDYLYNYLDDWGVKNMNQLLKAFNASCKDTSYLNKINTLYDNGVKARASHLIKTYKTVDAFNLDIHLFFPDSLREKSKRPVFVYFTGGSWTKGNPEWLFSSCENQAKKGYVAAVVEYRLADRQNTTPFDAVKDAKSAIRWLRQHAAEYNIDTARIVASGNSAGGHLILATALSTKLNESTDDLRYSASPNLLLVNSGVYDFIEDKTTAWVTQGKEKNTVKEISPVHLVRKGLPPMLILHGTNDHSVPYESAKLFASLMKEKGNDLEFHTLEGASHEIWFDKRVSGTVYQLRDAFLQKHGYE